MLYKASQIFVPGGLPTHTYNPRSGLRLELQLREYLDSPFKVATVTGPTKAGKTVLVKTVLPTHSSVWVPGGLVGKEEGVFWESLLERMELFNTVEKGEERATEQGIEGGFGAGANVGVVKVDLSTGGSKTDTRGASLGHGRTVSPKVAALEGLLKAAKPLVIDDFHYMTPEVQASVMRGLREIVFEGVPVILLAVPHRRYDAVRVEREMTGRVRNIEVPPWGINELLEIPARGFPLLAVSHPPALANRFALESQGSPHLMQEFCLTSCRDANIAQTLPGLTKLPMPPDVDGFFRRAAASAASARPSFTKLARGPKQRSDRKRRKFIDGTEGDIYLAVLRALSRVAVGKTEIEYEELRSGLKSVLADGLPQQHEVSRVLEHMTTIAREDETGVPVLEWDKGYRILHITDPYFAFYLRWGGS